MTILNLVPDTGDELPSRQISRRIRGLMAESRISGVKMAEAIGMSQRAFARRYADEVDWTVDELVVVARVFGMPFAELCAIRDSNPEPADSEPSRPELAALAGSVVSNVVPLNVGRSRSREIVCARPVLAVVQGGAA